MARAKQRRWYHLSVGDIIALVAVLFGLVVLGIYYSDQVREYNFVDIRQPVELDKDEYKVGDVIYGFFYGEIYTNNQPVVLRRLECANQRFSIVPVVTSSAVPTKLTGKKVPILKLEPASISVRGANFEPDTDCFIEMCSTYSIQPVFGNVRSLGECYYTDKFNITAADVPAQQPREEATVTAPSAPSVPAVPRESKGVTVEQGQTQTIQGTTVRPDSEMSSEMQEWTKSQPDPAPEESGPMTGVPLLDGILQTIIGRR